MTSILALAVVGSWTYAGFLAEPAPAPPVLPPASGPLHPAAPTRPASPAIDFGPTMKPEPEPEPETEPKAPAAEPPPVPPSASIPSPAPRYRLADSSGQAWEHADPEYLRSFVETRNRSFAPRNRYYSAPAYRSSRCTTGRCP